MRIVGMMVVGNGEAGRYLERSLQEMKRLADDALICCNNTDKATEAMIKKYGFDFYRDDREWGIYQPVLKMALMRKLQDKNPDYVLAFDSDEIFDSHLTRKQLDILVEQDQPSWYFFVIDHWNDEDHFNKSLSFWNIRLFKYDRRLGFEYDKRHVHCGLAPIWAYSHGRYAPFLLRHFGLMKKEDRDRRVARYNKYDPNAVYKGKAYYDQLASEMEPEPFNEVEWHNKVANEVGTYRKPNKKQIMLPKTGKYVIISRENGSLIDVPEHQVAETLMLHPFWKVVSKVDTGDVPPPVIEPTVVEEKPVEVVPEQLIECPLCGKQVKDERSLKIHKTVKHKV